MHYELVHPSPVQANRYRLVRPAGLGLAKVQMKRGDVERQFELSEANARLGQAEALVFVTEQQRLMQRRRLRVARVRGKQLVGRRKL